MYFYYGFSLEYLLVKYSEKGQILKHIYGDGTDINQK